MILHSGWGFVSFCSGAIVEATSVMQYRSVLKTLKPVEFPEGYWVEIGVYTNLLVATIGVAIIFISFLAYSEVARRTVSHGSFLKVLWVSARLGLTSFGGPGWATNEQFVAGYGATQAVPDRFLLFRIPRRGDEF